MSMVMLGQKKQDDGEEGAEHDPTEGGGPAPGDDDIPF